MTGDTMPIGTMSEYFPDDPTVMVRLKPDELLVICMVSPAATGTVP